MTTHAESGSVIRASGRQYPLPTVTTAHERIHEGVMYHGGVRSEALADDGNLDLFLIVNSAMEIHARFEAACGGDAVLNLYENPFSNTNSLGTEITPRNRHREIGDVSDAGLYSAPWTDANSLGTNLTPGAIIPGGATGNSPGGQLQDGFFEWDLDKGNQYLFRLTNRGGSAKIASAELNFYERAE